MASVNKKDSMKKKIMPKVVKHLKDDIRTFGKEANDDKALIIDIEMSGKKMKKDTESKKHEKAESKAEEKFEKVMREFKKGDLHSGSKKGPQVKNPKQAVAIAFSEKKRVTKKRKK
jgi:methanogenic corrinoid protein MtbC1